ncbi:TetR/AcrR family transcriptional regulator [Algisphaera agarilytica]|uniref:AcrR family transcriptional regulator n=1 Tax=Algisphaera agarilytica TaxID=1385975 RepID=A0A7X0H723_9BACT|nr:TetR/AcrR family transcriptional regulator [Algisphaera agarilytica]MBB6430303.1 AcrR family transcriptional regulator [Algisphaera agarilytica]
MARPNRSDQRKTELTPVLAKAFADLGYRSATTAALAEACGLRENQLYRLWPSKKAMFLATLDYLYELETRWWEEQLAADPKPDAADPGKTARRILDEEGKSRGETGLHRIIFAGLSESDDPEISAALTAMYQRFHKFIADVLKRYAKARDTPLPDHAAQPNLAAWSLIALATFSNIAREFDLFPIATQRKLMAEVGSQIAGLNPS